MAQLYFSAKHQTAALAFSDDAQILLVAMGHNLNIQVWSAPYRNSGLNKSTGGRAGLIRDPIPRQHTRDFIDPCIIAQPLDSR